MLFPAVLPVRVVFQRIPGCPECVPWVFLVLHKPKFQVDVVGNRQLN